MALASGLTSYLTKPVGLKLLAETIWTHLHPGPAPEDPRPAAA